MLPITKILDPDDHYDGQNKVEYIVEHDTGNKTDSDEGNANYFISGTRNASAHYFVDDDSITQVVLDSDGAFHCGDGYGKYGITNRNSIGIEMCRVNGTVTAKTEQNAIELTKYLMAKYNVPIDKVVRHYDASRKICPQSFSANNWERWNKFKAKLVESIASAQQVLKDMYRVRRTWSDANSQIGAYKDLENAKVLADKNVGYKVFDDKGKVVYPILKYDESIPTGDKIFKIPNTDFYIEQATDGRMIIHKDRGNYIAIGKGFIDVYWNDNNGHSGSKRISD